MGSGVYAAPVNDVDPLEVAAWRMAVGRLRSEELPDLATDALVRGLDSPSLRLLAGQPRDDVRDSADLFRAALDELGINAPDADGADWNFARRLAGEIVAGRISPARGADDLWMMYRRVMDNGDLRIFVGLASELQDHPEAADELARQIVAEAQALLDRAEPRRWIKLMALPGRSPLTQTAGHDQVRVDLEALHLSDRLRADVARWGSQFAATLGGWPESGGFASIQAAERFVEAGRHLVERLQDELGPTYHVEYMPEPIRPPGVKLRGARSR